MAAENNMKLNEDGSITIVMNEKAITFRVLEEAPENPETGVNYRITPEGLVGAFGAPVYGAARKGTENKVAVVFCGGGVAYDDYMAARPFSLNDRVPENGYYSDEAGLMTDIIMNVGLLKKCPENPLQDWTVIWIPYTTGDFHTGTADVRVTDIDGNERDVHFHGWINTKAIIERTKAVFGLQPDELLVTGFSAGGFATALLTDSLIDLFPTIRKCWCMPDSALMVVPDNQKIARDYWKAPEKVWRGMTGEGFVLPSLLNLKKNRGDLVQLLYICSKRDAALCTFTDDIGNHRNHSATKENADRFEQMLYEFVEKLRAAVPDVSVFLFDNPDHGYPVVNPEEAKVTEHTIIVTSGFYSTCAEGKTVSEWLADTLAGKPAVLGL